MLRDELDAELSQMEGYTSINQRYHQAMVGRWGKKDQRMKIVLAIATVASFALTMLDFTATWFWTFNFLFGTISLVAAVSLTYLGYDTNERSHAESFARWTYLRQDVETTRMRLKIGRETDLKVLSERLPEIIAKISEIEKQELPPDEDLLLKCQHDENESFWGEGIRTNKQIEDEKSRRRKATADESSEILESSAHA